MMRRWFNRSSRLDDPDPARRLQAVAQLTAEQANDAQQMLAHLATEDESTEVRAAAIAHLTDEARLQALLDDERIARKAARRIAQLLNSGSRFNCSNHPLVFEARIEACPAERLDTLIADVTSAEQAATLAIRARDAQRERFLGLAVLNDEDGLGTLAKLAKGHDKACHRHARQRLEVIRQARNACTEALQRLAEIDDSIDRQLAADGPDFGSMSEAARRKLEKLGIMRTEVAEALHAHCASLAEAGGTTDQFAQPADPLADIDLTFTPPDNDPFEGCVETLHRLAESMRRGEDPQKVADQHQDVISTWLAHADKHPPNAAQHAIFEASSSQFQTYKEAWSRLNRLSEGSISPPDPLPENLHASEIGDLLKNRRAWLKKWHKPIDALNWPDGHDVPERLNQARQWLSTNQANIASLEARLEASEKDLQNFVKQSQRALDDGHVNDAIANLRKARDLQKAGLNEFNRELTALSARVDEYRDWQRFATNPKRQELLNELTALADAPKAPQTQADRLRALRDQWRQLGRPTNAAEAQLMKDFDALAERAFEPCKVYFADQAEQRAANLSKRQELCQQLQDYLENTDWTTADMQAADAISRTARAEWRKYHPCNRKALKPVEARFEALQNELHGKLKSAWDANAARKRQIIEHAQALLSGAIDEQISGAKALQQQWREVGPIPRGTDQKLWREFRQICDGIFEARDVARAQHDAEKQAWFESLQAAVARFEHIADAQDQPATRKELDTLRAEVDTAADGQRIPGALHKRLQSATDAYQRRINQAQRQTQIDKIGQWAVWDAELSNAEQCGEPFEPPHAVFAQRANGNGQPADWHRLVIEAEIAADLPSPADEQQLRMALQIELMNDGIKPHERPYQDMLKSWCAAGPKDAEADALRERFFSAVAARAQAD